MKNFSITDETFDPNISLSYFLSIRLNPDGLSFCTLDPVKNRYIQLRHVVFDSNAPTVDQLEENFSRLDLLNLPFKRTFILVPSQKSTLVPSGAFQSDRIDEMLRFSCNVPEGYTVHYNKIRMADAFNIFAVPNRVEAIIRRQFPEPLFFHQNTPFIDSILSTTVLDEENISLMCIDFNTDFFDIVVIEKGRLKLCNSFPIKSDNDFIYFTLFVFEQLKLTEATTSVYISGLHQNKQQFVQQLSHYLSKIKSLDFPRHFRYSPLFKDVQATGFYNLLNLPVCV
ncbi:MAG: DUF3822 family protein [Cytophagaceae bacterium]|jgi:hypothetical protein|nr:DUF3822 family protein [Cytophagaceae bacterium]